jgi:hypothetical protein
MYKDEMTVICIILNQIADELLPLPILLQMFSAACSEEDQASAEQPIINYTTAAPTEAAVLMSLNAAFFIYAQAQRIS